MIKYYIILFYLQEQEQLKRNQTRSEDEMVRRHHADKKRLPSILKREAATRQQMFKQSLRISMITSVDEEKEKVKQVIVTPQSGDDRIGVPLHLK